MPSAAWVLLACLLGCQDAPETPAATSSVTDPGLLATDRAVYQAMVDFHAARSLSLVHETSSCDDIGPSEAVTGQKPWWIDQWRSLQTNERVASPVSAPFVQDFVATTSIPGRLPADIVLPPAWQWIDRAACEEAWDKTDTTTEWREHFRGTEGWMSMSRVAYSPVIDGALVSVTVVPGHMGGGKVLYFLTREGERWVVDAGVLLIIS